MIKKKTQKDFMTTEPAEQKILEGIFQSEGKRKYPKRS